MQLIRVLVVDDDPLMRDYMETLLTSMNYRAIMASAGANAVALLESDSKFDLLLTDIRLEGGMNGWELGRQARALREDLPILYTSGDPDMPDPCRDKRLKETRMLRKPFRARDLSAAIVAAIGG